MAKLTWDSKDYEVGIDRGVFFPLDGFAEAWNGLVSFNENMPDIRSRTVYRDGVKVTNQRSEDSFSGTIEAFTYPPALENKRLVFGFSYRVHTEDSYKIHLVYNARAHFPNHSYQMDQYNTFSIGISTTPVAVVDSKATAHFIIDASVATPGALEHLESFIYGDETRDARLPSPEEVMAIFEADPVIKVIDNGDGTFTVDGPDDLVHMLSDTEFEIISPVAIYVDGETYVVRTF